MVAPAAIGARWARLLVLLMAAQGCSTRARFAQTATEPRSASARDASSDAKPNERDADIASCPEALADRISISRVAVQADIRYKKSGYDRFPLDERIALSVAANGRAELAWLENGGARIRVTPLDAALARRAPDVVLRGIEVGGLVARDDGFALLTRRDDPGEPLADPAASGTLGKAAFLVRVRGASEAFARPLTGTSSITLEFEPGARDCAPDLRSRLAWNGEKYGAYFQVHGCEGDAHAPYYGDKLVYIDDDGEPLRGGWRWNCSIPQGLRLLPEADVFTSLCMSDGAPYPGLNLVVEGRPYRQLAPEMVDIGYAAGQFGSVVKLSDGSYVVGWLSRGVTDAGAARPDSAKVAQDIALLRLGADYASLGDPRWLFETPDVAETNLHLAPYGADRLLVVWDSIGALRCTASTCFGDYTGTHARLIDLRGNFLTPEARIDAVPNHEDDIVVFPNGDLGWAFVADEDRSYAAPLNTDSGVPRVPTQRQLSIARVRLCP